ncbi:hypothetical protein [Deinococcus sp. Leaf326]|uniref:hypothetical protein n=1 Tax=Deinococcus sp. Leaf326 TaxID=1736338 RepID=UPI0006F3207C|nr:hypothetical protein [Deinococcus sp. Leaf326]KQR25576.1 hypothetical protein ASF71_19020 [Deinococcus sp. Leaf326]
MTISRHPQFQGFFLTDLEAHPETGEFRCVLTRHGHPIGLAQASAANRPVQLQLPEAEAQAFLELAQDRHLHDHEGHLLMGELLRHFTLDQLSLERQVLQTQTRLPEDVPTQIQFPLGMPVSAIAALADDPEYAPGLVQIYIRYQGWRPLPPRDTAPFQGFALLDPIEEPNEHFQCVLQRDGQAVGYLLTHPAQAGLRLNCAPLHARAFLHLAQTLNPQDHDGTLLVETILGAH